MNLGTGWLPSDQGPPEDVAGVHVPVWSAIENAPFPTRRCEYRWFAKQFEAAPRGTVLDAGAGFNPEIHLMPQILGNLGFDVLAVDAEPLSLQMPLHLKVRRYCGDLCDLPFAPASFDYWVCVSVLEHMEEAAKLAALEEAFWLLKPGGYALLTTDETEPSLVAEWLTATGFSLGVTDNIPPPSPLSPRVAFAVAQKP